MDVREILIKAYQDSHQIAEMLARRDPNNTDWQRDLIVSYVKHSEVFPDQRKKYLQNALDMVLKLDKERRLYQSDQWVIEDLKNRLGHGKNQ